MKYEPKPGRAGCIVLDPATSEDILLSDADQDTLKRLHDAGVEEIDYVPGTTTIGKSKSKSKARSV